MLAQWHEGALRPVKFASRSFTPVEGRWPTTHQELFAVKYSLEHFQPYLLGRAVTVITDHANLQWLTSISPQQSKLARWCLSMAEFDFQIKHSAGSANVVPDVLSRAPLTHPSTSGEDLYFPPQAVTCFITTLIGFDIPYLEPSRVSEIFSDSLTCLTLACNPTPLLSLATCLKPYPSGFPTGHSSLPNPTSQKDIYDRKARFLEIPSGKVVYIRKEPQTTRSGQATQFLRTFDGPFQVIGHPYDRTDLLTLKSCLLVMFCLTQ